MSNSRNVRLQFELLIFLKSSILTPNSAPISDSVTTPVSTLTPNSAPSPDLAPPPDSAPTPDYQKAVSTRIPEIWHSQNVELRFQHQLLSTKNSKKLTLTE